MMSCGLELNQIDRSKNNPKENSFMQPPVVFWLLCCVAWSNLEQQSQKETWRCDGDGIMGERVSTKSTGPTILSPRGRTVDARSGCRWSCCDLKNTVTKSGMEWSGKCLNYVYPESLGQSGRGKNPGGNNESGPGGSPPSSPSPRITTGHGVDSLPGRCDCLLVGMHGMGRMVARTPGTPGTGPKNDQRPLGRKEKLEPGEKSSGAGTHEMQLETGDRPRILGFLGDEEKPGGIRG